MKHFKIYTKEDILSVTQVRRFETRIGERLATLPSAASIEEAIQQSSAKFIVIGVI
jgi:formiminoglutamase